jgi:peptidoglycan/LPS O-acetylase OafA/YrhL
MVGGQTVIESVQRQTTGARLYFIDNLRTLLAVLVVMHHAGQPYGPGGGWWLPAEPASAIDTLILGGFFAVNMSFFMGLFFLISAYFVPGSYDRKGAWTFFKDRMTRLGIPILIFAFAVFPVMLYLLHGVGVTSFTDYYRNTYLSIAGMLEGQGFTIWHLWFLEQLLIFSGLYVLWRKATAGRRGSPLKKPFPGDLAIIAFTVAMGLAMFAVRIVFPVNFWLPFIVFEPAHYPEYIALFAVGLIAYRNDWFSALPASTGRKWGNVAILSSIVLFVLFVIFDGSLIAGGPTVASLAMSLWEAFMCVSMCIGLVALFRGRFNVQGKVAKALSDSSFTVYLIHIPVIVFLQYLLIGTGLPNLVKFAIVCLAGVPACFLLSHYVVRRLPFAKYVL